MNIKNFLLDAAAVGSKVDEILKGWVGPLFVAIGGVGCIYVIILGIQFIKSENDSKRAEAKSRMFNCIIGIISLLVIGAVCIGLNWAGLANMFGYASN